tara:strand:- start:261 stop:548 length:288 start_codon:yes stop_codon:yes gene_type:complete
MSWFEILKRMNESTGTAIIDIMSDGEKRTIRGVLDELYDRREKGSKLTVASLPTTHEIGSFLGKNYESGIFDTITGKQLFHKPKKPYHKRYYWRV